MNPTEQVVFDPFIPHKITHPPEKDIAHAKHIIQLLLPYAEREELSTQTSAYTRLVMEAANDFLKGN